MQILGTLLGVYIFLGSIFAWSYVRHLKRKDYSANLRTARSVFSVFLTWPADLYAILFDPYKGE